MKLTLFLLGGAFILGIGGFMFFKNNQIPDHVGDQSGNFAEMPSSPNAVSSRTEDEEKRVEPLTLQGDITSAKELLKTVLDDIEEIHVEKETDHYIHAVFTTNLMRYKNDIEFFFDEDAGVIHYRSESRVGYSDMGENRKQFEMIRDKYEEKLR